MITTIQYTIKLNEIKDIQTFIVEVSKLPCDVDLYTDKYIINAKSLIGIYTLDLTKAIIMKIHSLPTTVIDNFLNNIHSIILEEITQK